MPAARGWLDIGRLATITAVTVRGQQRATRFLTEHYQMSSGIRAMRVAVGLVTALFLFACCFRLNLSISTDPDGSDYLLTARSMAVGAGYRDPSQPGWPVHTVRPPGLPFLLIPAAASAPYNIVAAKLTVVVLAVPTSLLLWRTSSRLLREAAGFVVFLLFITSPATLWYATDILSEVPYTACTLAAILLTLRCDRRGDERAELSLRKPALIALWVLAAFAPLIRLVGVALPLAAIVTWFEHPRGVSRTIRARTKAAAFAATTLLPILSWITWIQLVQTTGTHLSLFSAPRPDGLVAWSIDSFTFYADAIAAYLFSKAPRFAGIGTTCLALMGWVLQRHKIGVGPLAYCSAYFALLVVYPCRDARLAWPLAPVMLVLLTAAVTSGLATLSSRSHGLYWLATRGLVLATGALVSYQLVVCVDWLTKQETTRTRLLRWGDLPPTLPSDCRAAGLWLQAHTPPYTSVLTRDKSLFVWSRRAQLRVRFETLSAEGLRYEIQKTRAQYLVMPSWGHGSSIPLERITHDPVYGFEKVFDSEGIIIYRVAINRTGTVPQEPADYSQILQSLESGEIARDQGPHNQFLRAHFLRRSGHASDALPLLKDLLEQNPRNLVAALELAACLVDAGSFEEANAWYRRAKRMPGAEIYADSVRAGTEVSLDFLRLNDRALANTERVQAGTRIAWAHLQMGRYAASLAVLNKCLDIAPSSGSCWNMKGLILQRLGRENDAIDACTLALSAGIPDAYPKLLMLKTAQAISGSEPVKLSAGERQFVVDPRKAEDFVNLATLAVRDGVPGFAVATLERARDRFPDNTVVHARLGELYEFYGEWSLAQAAWSRALELQPTRPTADRLAAVQTQMAPHPFP
jgi:tetratricopeptide (TPR) repeat protein